MVSGEAVVNDYVDSTQRGKPTTLDTPSLKVKNIRVPKSMRKFSD
jgi:hypothetical protein